MLKKLSRLLVITLISFVIAGCGPSWRYARPVPNQTTQGIALGVVGGAIVGGSSTSLGAPVGAVIGGIAGGIIGHCLSLHQSLVAKIAANDVQIIQVGDTLTFVLPADRFFEDGTPQLNRNYYSVLNQIAELLRLFDKFTVKVAGYTDNVGLPIRNAALSRAQAQAIANYLWTHNIDTRLISAVGYGCDAPVASNATEAGRAMNRRIEISMRLISDPDDM